MRRMHRRTISRRVSEGRERSAWGLAIAGVVVGSVCAMVMYAPAAWLAHGVALASQGRVQLLQAQGTVWQGSAALVLASPSGGTSAMTWPTRWSWRLQLDGWGGAVQVWSDCCMSTPLKVRVSKDGVHVQSATLKMPMAVLQGLGTPWNTLQLEGNLSVHSEALSLPWQMGALGWQGKIQLRAQQVSTRLSTLPEIGSYQVDLEGGAQPSIAVSTLTGALQIEGQGSMERGRWKFQGQAFAQPAQAKALANLLNLLGHRSGDKTRIQWG